MSSLFTNSIRLLSKSLQQVGGETVTYRRGNDSIDALVVVPVRVRHDDLPLDELKITAREQDFIVVASDLAIGEQSTLPKTGDLIDWDDEQGNRRTFRVLPRQGERAYRFSDPSRQMIRIFTVEQKTSGE